MTRQGTQLPFGRQVPDPDRVVSTAGSKEPAIPAKSNFGNAFAVAFEITNLTTAGNVPEPYLTGRLNLNILHEILGIGSRLILGSFPRVHGAAHHCSHIEIRLRL